MKNDITPSADAFITVRAEAHDEIVIQKSRFIGYAAPCETEEAALAFLQTIRDAHRDARHHCYAYIIGLNSGVMRYSDDGEPGGTAGLPMMDVLKNEKVVNCCTVVVRYFGGVLLGTGGLVRAYTQGCKIALQAAGLIRMERSEIVQCRLSYPLWNNVQYAMQKMPVQVESVEYSQNVSFILAVRKKDTDPTVQRLQNLTDGKIECDRISEEYRSWALS